MFRTALKKNIVWKNVLDALCRLGYQSSLAKVCDVLEIQYDGAWSKTGSEVSPLVGWCLSVCLQCEILENNGMSYMYVMEGKNLHGER